MKRRIKAAIINSDEAYCSRLKAVLEIAPGICRVCVHSNLPQALAELPRLLPDVVLADIALAGSSPAEFVQVLRDGMPNAVVVVLTGRQDEASIVGALQAGASGYLLKDNPLAVICDAVGEAAAGDCPLAPQVARALATWLHARASAGAKEARLSHREQQILSLAAGGAHNKVIADTLRLSEATVRAHLRTAYEKFHVHSRAQAVACLR